MTIEYFHASAYNMPVAYVSCKYYHNFASAFICASVITFNDSNINMNSRFNILSANRLN